MEFSSCVWCILSFIISSIGTVTTPANNIKFIRFYYYTYFTSRRGTGDYFDKDTISRFVAFPSSPFRRLHFHRRLSQEASIRFHARDPSKNFRFDPDPIVQKIPSISSHSDANPRGNSCKATYLYLIDFDQVNLMPTVNFQ